MTFHVRVTQARPSTGGTGKRSKWCIGLAVANVLIDSVGWLIVETVGISAKRASQRHSCDLPHKLEKVLSSTI